jgi:hypothetical protein
MLSILPSRSSRGRALVGRANRVAGERLRGHLPGARGGGRRGQLAERHGQEEHRQHHQPVLVAAGVTARLPPCVAAGLSAALSPRECLSAGVAAGLAAALLARLFSPALGHQLHHRRAARATQEERFCAASL